MNDDRMEVDHIIPKSRGGKNSYENFQLLHRHCHLIKTAKDAKKQEILDRIDIEEQIKAQEKINNIWHRGSEGKPLTVGVAPAG